MNEKSHLYLVIMAGGSGTRFWPKSTSKKPKQLLNFGGSDSQVSTLLAQTLSRFEGWVPKQQRIVVTTHLLKDSIEKLGLKIEILPEPQGRNTAPCIYWAAQHIFGKDRQAVMLVMPSDHFIANPERFSQSVQMAAEWAMQTQDLVTLGIRPTRPETGYGYLKTEDKRSGEDSNKPRKVTAFVEKPSLEKAKEFVASPNYFWNGGMFLWRAEVILRAFDELMPEMSQAWTRAQGKVDKAYPDMPATSIDYGIMERAKNVVTFPLDCGWDDLGSWTSLENLAPLIGAQNGPNVVTGGDLLAIESSGNIVDAPDRLVAILGVDDLIIVESGKSLLVAKKDRAQDIRKIVDELKKKRPDLV